MDLLWIYTVGAGFMAGAIAGFIGGSAVGYLKDLRIEMRMDGIEARVQRMHLERISGPAGAAHSQQAARMKEAMAWTVMEMGKEGADAKAVLAQALEKYPDVASSVMEKTLKGKGPFGPLLSSFMGKGDD